MRHSSLVAVLALVAGLVWVVPAGAHHAGLPPATDDPSADPRSFVMPGGLSSVTPPTARVRPQALRRSSRGRAAGAAPRGLALNLTGALELEPSSGDAHADVAAFRSLAFVGKWSGPGCPGTGVDIVSIARPDAPQKVADTVDHARTSMEDMQAMRINGRDVLATGLQTCAAIPGQPAGVAGLELHDITDPAAPSVLSFLPTGAGGVHEFDLTRTPSGRTLALLAVPNLEVTTADDLFRGGQGDLLVVDVSDPARPTLVSEWGLLDSGRFGVDFYAEARQGADARSYLHSVRANAEGTRAYLSYWDAGVITLDITNPAAPRVLGRTAYEPGDEGNAHSVDEARGGELLLQADEDYTAYEASFTSSAFSGTRPAAEASFGPGILASPGRALAGEVVHVGRGCPAGSPAPDSPEDPYLADPRGKIALVERGVCPFDAKAARAVQAGAVGVIIYQSEAGGEQLFVPGGASTVTLPTGPVEVTVPVLGVRRSVGLALAAAPGATIRVSAEFNGWGFLRIWDNRNPADPVPLSTFATPNTLSADTAAAAGDRWYTVHNPEVVGNRAYVSWYADGVRAIDFTRPRAPREVGAWVGQGRPADAPPVDIWSVVPHRGLLLASDRNYGLYVLTPDAGR